MLIDSNSGRLILATADGLDQLVSFDKGLAVFESLDKQVGRPARGGGNLLEDKKGRLWHSGGWLDPDSGTWHDFASEEAGDIGTTWWGSYTQTRDGLLLYGGTEGIRLIRPELWTPWTYQPPLVISELQINNKNVPVSDTIRLSPDSNNLTLEFSALDFSAPQSNRYAYQLVGFDKDWVETDASNRRATYTNLPSGDYRLRIKGTNRNGQWSKHEIDLPITRLPAWHETLWFKFLLLLGFSGLLYALFQWRLRHLNKQKDELDNLVKARTANISMLGTIGQNITSSLHLDTVLDVVYKNVNELMTAETFSIGMLDEEQGIITYTLVIENGERIPSSHHSLEESTRPAVWCIKNNKVLHINHAEELKHYVGVVEKPVVGGETESLIYLPLSVDNRVIGCITVQSFKKNAYSNNDILMLNTIANYTAIAMANAASHA